ncbi:hypothetical protein CROQUDRAFT_673946 [Cronartium quercuum f. sp. fusiforme G11]|uniref:Zinc-finger domain-containing protein n=1 Tax=Cronartium quercuum f. sp. fusiforme G11 TaxID=708437 RepID=A0A9P6N8C0_9BASI|nr:hypothetical protein CROQUDRAFT_673946 [Cronartium quercuum f. sp. fusiforme G11]
MLKGDSINSNLLNSTNSSSPAAPSTENPSMLNPLLPTRFQASPPQDLPAPHQDHSQTSSAYPIENPLLIRNLFRNISPPFKPFGSQEPEVDQDTPDSPNHLILLSPNLQPGTSSMAFPPTQADFGDPPLESQPSSSSLKRIPYQRVYSNHEPSQRKHVDGKVRAPHSSGPSNAYTRLTKDGKTRKHEKNVEAAQIPIYVVDSDQEGFPESSVEWQRDQWRDDNLIEKHETRKKTKALNSNSPEKVGKSSSKARRDLGHESLSPKNERRQHKSSIHDKRRKHSRDLDGPSFNPPNVLITPRSPRPERNRIARQQLDFTMENGAQIEDLQDDSYEPKTQREYEQPKTSTSCKPPSLRRSPDVEPIDPSGSSLGNVRTRTLSGTSVEVAAICSPSHLSNHLDERPHPTHTDQVHEESDDEPPKKKSRPKRPQPPPVSTGSSPSGEPDEHGSPNSNPSPATGASNKQVVYRIPTIIPASVPDAMGQYESSTCHQCRIKTTRPKMICDQSQDPNCVVRVCVTCLMVREVYDDHPELRPPKFEFVPGGRMLCVKCRNLCPCASCRRRRGEKEQCRRGLGGGTKGFYGLTPEEREQAFIKKKEKQEAIRLKKEARPPTEKKTPVVCRREAAAIRHTGFDDDIEQERLQHWAPLPVFPPLPPARKKKRKRLDNLDPARLDCKTGHSESESSCSDSDSNYDTDSEAMSVSSASSDDFHPRNNTVLDPAAFKLSLSTHPPRSLSLSKRWRANGTCEDSSTCPEHVLRAVKRKTKSKAPIVWIKGGAVIQARKPPTKEFMEKLAEEQKVKSTCGSTVAGEEDLNPSNSEQAVQGQDHEDIKMTNGTILGHLNLEDNDLMHTSLQSPSHPINIGTSTTDEAFNSLRPLTVSGDPSKSDWLAPSPRGSNVFVHLSLHAAMQRSHTPQDPPPLIQHGNPFSQAASNPTSDHHVASVESSRGLEVSFNSSLHPDTGPAPTTNGIDVNSSHSGHPKPIHEFGCEPTPLDHQAYLAGLTDEQLTDVLKQGSYEMANQGFLPSPLTGSHSSMKYTNQDGYSTGISPELISASLPVPTTSMAEAGEMTNELTEEDQQMRLIEAANWAAVWGATDGVGGFSLTQPGSGANQDEMTTDKNRPSTTTNTSSLSSPTWEHEAGDKELFLKAMKSSVGDEWLTDVMPLDNSY